MVIPEILSNVDAGSFDDLQAVKRTRGQRSEGMKGKFEVLWLAKRQPFDLRAEVDGVKKL